MDGGDNVLFRISNGRLFEITGTQVDWSGVVDARLSAAWRGDGKDPRDPVPDPGWNRADGVYRLIGPGLEVVTPFETARLTRYLLVPEPTL